jgi:organic radical activating enzyme
MLLTLIKKENKDQKKTIGMRNILIILLLAAISVNINAQNNNQLTNGKEITSLINDTQSQEVAKQKLTDESSSVLKKFNDLTERQKTKIVRLENSRNNKLDKINKRIGKKKKQLSSLMPDTSNNVLKIEKIKAKIAKLAIRKQKLQERTLMKIRKTLTADQQKLL